MPVFTAAATFIASAIGVTSAFGIAAINFGVRVLATSIVSSLISNRQQNPNTPSLSQTTGSRVQLPASTDNKIGVVYGSAFISPAMVDAKISTDQKTIWYVLALTEVTDTGIITMGDINSATNTDIYWGDKQLVFGASDRTRVTSWINGNGESDTKVNGNMFVYLYKNGSSMGANTTESAINVLSDSSIDPAERWNGPRYTYTGASPTMSGVCFAIVKLIYNQNANITGLEQFKIKITNTLTKPGDVIYDYLTNTRYGCAIPSAQVDMTSINNLNTYSDQLITYTPVGGGTATQPRYTISGPMNTGATCLTNLQYLVDSCDSWLQWNESVAKWSVIPNRSYTDYTVYDDLFIIEPSNVISGVNVSPVDLNSTYNLIESQFPNNKIKDQTDYNFVYLPNEDMNPNEPINKLVIQYPLVNNSVQAQYLATRRLIQSREDLSVNFSMDYSGIQLDAGDVVRMRHPAYGWGPLTNNPTNPDKLFRVEQVQESKADDGSLGVHISLIEYNNQVYENINIEDYDPAANTGITDPFIVGTPAAPTISNINIQSNTFTVDCVVPNVGQIIAMEFWYGPTIAIENNNYRLWDTQYNSTTPVYTAGTSESSNVVGLEPGTYYWAIRAITQSTKSAFSNTTSQEWSPAQPATRKTCSQETSQTVSYTDLYKLWAANTRGSVLTCDYTPTENGSDVGGKSTNQIQLDISINEYTSGLTTGLVAEIWTAVKSFGFPIYAMGYGSNGYIISSGSTLFFTGNMQGATTANPDTYIIPAVGVGTDIIRGIAANGTRYVAVGDNGRVITSNTGYNNWTSCVTPTASATIGFSDVVWNGTLFVAVGGVYGPSTGTMYIMTSTDGITWTQRVNTTSTSVNNLNTVAWNGTSFLALGDGFAKATSSNGTTWTTGSVSGGNTISITSCTWDTNYSRWIAVGSNNVNGKVYTSADASTFTLRYTSSTPGILRGVATNFDYYDDTFAVGDNGEIIYSGDGGVTWTVQSSQTSGNLYVCEKLNGSFYIAGEPTSKPYVWPISTSTTSFDYIELWQTIRSWAYGSSQTDPYDTTIQDTQYQLPNNIPVPASIKTGAYFKNTVVRYLLVAGDLNNPTTPSTVYASRKSIGITEFKG